MAELGRVLRTVAVIAFIGVAFWWVLAPSVHPASDRARVSRAENDMRTVSLGLEAYHLDHGAYPVPVASRSEWTVLPPVLTTPMAYLSVLPRDHFEGGEGTYGYALLADNPAAWGDVALGLGLAPEYVLLTQGPRGKRGVFGLDWENVYDPTNGTKSGGYVFRFGGTATMEENARSGQNVPDRASDDKEAAFTYDPSNGTVEHQRGRVRQ